MSARNHPHRKPNRLATFDYNTVGAYFITMCVQDRACIFGSIANDAMQLNPIGEIARDCWQEIPQHFAFADIDAFVVMPNHVHGIILIRNESGLEEKIGTGKNDGIVRTVGNADHGRNAACIVGNNDRCSLRGHLDAARTPRNMEAIPKIMSQYKSSVSRRIRHAFPSQPFAWQKSFHDRVIRDDQEMQRIRDYIAANPAAWLDGELFSEH